MTFMNSVVYFLAAFGLSVVFTVVVSFVARALKIVDLPDADRKLHTTPVPLLGGVAIFAAFWVVTGYLLFNPVKGIELLTNKLMAAGVASTIVLLIGIADEVRPFSAKARLALTAVATLVAVLLGLGLEKVTNPLGGYFALSSFIGGAVVFVWLMGMMYTTKILDGLDGLSTGTVAIGAFMMYFLTQTKQFYQPNVGIIALVFAGVCLGFLIFNFYSAKIFLGESGSLFIGFMLGVLAVIGGGKMATALLVMAVPMLDLARVMFVRFRRAQPVMQGDREHLHFQLLDWGLSQPQAVLLLYGVSAVLGVLTLFLQSRQKVVLLLVLVVAMVVAGWRIGKK